MEGMIVNHESQSSMSANLEAEKKWSLPDSFVFGAIVAGKASARFAPGLFASSREGIPTMIGTFSSDILVLHHLSIQRRLKTQGLDQM